jgi:hypothetical protein
MSWDLIIMTALKLVYAIGGGVGCGLLVCWLASKLPSRHPPYVPPGLSEPVAAAWRAWPRGSRLWARYSVLAAMPLLWISVVWRSGFLWGTISGWYLAVLALAALTDLEHLRIYPGVMVLAMLIAAVIAPFSPWVSTTPWMNNKFWAALISGIALFIVFFWLLPGLGRGLMSRQDAYPAAFIGLTLGFDAYCSVTLSFLLIAIFGIFAWIIRRITKIEILPYILPVAPFLSIGAALCFVLYPCSRLCSWMKLT